MATDQVYSDVPSFDGGYLVAQFFTGIYTKVCDIIGLRNERDFVTSLQEIIRKHGAMDQLVSDKAQVEISNKTKDILRHHIIDD